MIRFLFWLLAFRTLYRIIYRTVYHDLYAENDARYAGSDSTQTAYEDIPGYAPADEQEADPPAPEPALYRHTA